ncbi:MAG TPA: hypothetical protein DCZ95_14385 [Verrucomicrobia bacterium]|nr:MAG: hypothetical protein A2X46_03520 [Lentisphaerae bacterium GWF2_57_35]HBA85272.1 hypothetical protein [Verrucomicrobiota bacterium]
MKRTRILMAVLLIFFSGLLAGFVGGLGLARYQVARAIEKGPKGIRQIVMRRLTHELKLTDAQLQAIDPIVDRAHKNLRQVRLNQQPTIQRIVEQALFEMRPELTDAQNKKLDAMKEKIDRQWGLRE